MTRPLLYEDEHTQIFLANCLDAPKLALRPVHLLVTSPPYNLGKDYGVTNDQLSYRGYLDDVERWAGAWCKVLAPGARVAINIPIDSNGERTGRGKGSRKLTTEKRFLLADYHQIFSKLGYIYNTTILWDEGNISRRTAWGSWKSASDPWVTTPTEAILVYSWKMRRRPDAPGKESDIWRDEFLEWSLGTWRLSGKSPHRNGSHIPAFPSAVPSGVMGLFSPLVNFWKRRGPPSPLDAKTALWRDELIDWSRGRWRFSGESPRRVGGHPAAFPPELPRRLIKLFSFRGDTVLDPFNGSGTTTAVARALGRDGIGFDIEEKYAAYAAKRAQATPFGSDHVADPFVRPISVERGQLTLPG